MLIAAWSVFEHCQQKQRIIILRNIINYWEEISKNYNKNIFKLWYDTIIIATTTALLKRIFCRRIGKERGESRKFLTNIFVILSINKRYWGCQIVEDEVDNRWELHTLCTWKTEGNRQLHYVDIVGNVS